MFRAHRASKILRNRQAANGQLWLHPWLALYAGKHIQPLIVFIPESDARCGRERMWGWKREAGGDGEKVEGSRVSDPDPVGSVLFCLDPGTESFQ